MAGPSRRAGGLRLPHRRHALGRGRPQGRGRADRRRLRASRLSWRRLVCRGSPTTSCSRSSRDQESTAGSPWFTRRTATSSTTSSRRPGRPAETSTVMHAETRPEWTEAEAASRAIWLAASARRASLRGARLLRQGGRGGRQSARGGSGSLRAETCTHYLTLSKADLERPD